MTQATTSAVAGSKIPGLEQDLEKGGRLGMVLWITPAPTNIPYQSEERHKLNELNQAFDNHFLDGDLNKAGCLDGFNANKDVLPFYTNDLTIWPAKRREVVQEILALGFIDLAMEASRMVDWIEENWK